MRWEPRTPFKIESALLLFTCLHRFTHNPLYFPPFLHRAPPFCTSRTKQGSSRSRTQSTRRPRLGEPAACSRASNEQGKSYTTRARRGMASHGRRPWPRSSLPWRRCSGQIGHGTDGRDWQGGVTSSPALSPAEAASASSS